VLVSEAVELPPVGLGLVVVGLVSEGPVDELPLAEVVELFTSVVVVAAVVDGGVVLVVLVLGGLVLVLEAVLQSKEIVGTWMLQLGLGLLGWGG
jgi:hypothetical protein